MILKTILSDCALNGTNQTEYKVNQPIVFNFEHNCIDDIVECKWNCCPNCVTISLHPPSGPIIINATVTIEAKFVESEGLYTLLCSVNSLASYMTTISVTSGESIVLLNYYAKQELLDVERHSSITHRTLAPFIKQTPTPTSSIDAGSLATFSKLTWLIILCVHTLHIVCMAPSLLPSYSSGLPQSPSPSSGERNLTQCCIIVIFGLLQ